MSKKECEGREIIFHHSTKRLPAQQTVIKLKTAWHCNLQQTGRSNLIADNRDRERGEIGVVADSTVSGLLRCCPTSLLHRHYFTVTPDGQVYVCVGHECAPYKTP